MFRFTIRDVLWLMVVAAWWADRVSQAKHSRAMESRLAKAEEERAQLKGTCCECD